MRHLTFVDKNTYTTALLIKESAFTPKELQDHYSIDWTDTICFSLDYQDNKAPVKFIKEKLITLVKMCKHLGVTHLLVCDTNYFKAMAKVTKAENLYGSILEYEGFKIVLAPNYQALFYNPAVQSKLDLAVKTLTESLSGSHQKLGEGIIHFEAYPSSHEVLEWLEKLLSCATLTCDIETAGLSLAEAELLSISFAWDQHSGVAFEVTPDIKPLLKAFFEYYPGKLIFHNATFDCTHLIYRLFMKDYLDYEGMLHGLETLTRNLEDTKIITYLATNSCAGNDLKLKNLALAYAGDYALLDDETLAKDIPIAELLRYNLMDCLSTWYVYSKYRPIMIQDDQLKIYLEVMLPSLKSIIHMQLVGFPMDMDQIQKTDKELHQIQKKWLKVLRDSSLVKDCEWLLQVEAFTKKNNELKTKFIPLSQFKAVFNPNSGRQVSMLLYDQLRFPVLNTTDTGLPSTDGDTLEALYSQLMNQYNLTEEDLL